MFDPSAVFYMEKLVTGPEAADVVDINAPVVREHPPGRQGQGQSPEDVTVVILDRPRHDGSSRRSGRPARASSSSPTATSRARSLALREGTGIDLLLGIGGTPEGIIAACAMKCLGGTIQGKLWPKDDEERRRRRRSTPGSPRPGPRTCSTTDDLVTGDDCFFVATGITDGELLQRIVR
jgi:fructose-1,6-bisphosphatase II